ncbi:hypothetical protein ACJRO7_015355 [Eucalyptus globulus]|uniref:TIR domain-containing protein n=1 Tax=Eucalyptus globulus TaxID=34317 RepID=A0ABD3L461_EUCGL
MANSDAGRASSSNARGGGYEVFLNFCDQDTGEGFTSFLHRDLRRNCVRVFMYDEELRVGEETGGGLLRAIDDSQIYIPIFSKNYASNKWCLRELARMLDNTSKSEEKKILPIFYDVEPKDVDLKTPVYRTAIEMHKVEHEKKQREKFPHEVEYWEEALKKIDQIKGWELQKCKSQAELVDLVVEKVFQELKIRYKSMTEDLVGLDDRVAEILKLLDVNCSYEVRLLGIHGMGGIGKTTIAKVVYNDLSSCFVKCCAFLDDIRETVKKEGLVSLQKKLLKDIDSSGAVDTINDVDYGRRRIEATLGNKKVLIVLDDIDEEKQIENLIGQHRLHPGTRVIITTRNTSLLEFIEQRMARERKEMNSDHAPVIPPYKMKGMNFDDALQLFKKRALVDNSEAKDFDRLSRDIVFTTGGLPLTLEVIGSFLFRKPKRNWKNTLKQLKKMPHEHVQEKLMISYKALNYRQREIFLDVACFSINEDTVNANYMWEACEFNPNLEIYVLVGMSLIKIKDNNKFWMHHQLRDLGREIVRQQSLTNLGKRSRMWNSEEVLDLVKTQEIKEDVGALDLRGSSSHISISHEEIERFKSLRFLRLYNGNLHGDFFICLPKLRWISWRSPSPNVSVPSMHSKNLVVLELFDNHFKDDSKVWDLIKMATKLKNLTLVNCHCITRTPDLSKCLDLERLTFDDCGGLKEIDNSIGKLKCLLDLNITLCELIESVPNEIGELVKLERFSLMSCCTVSKLPTSISNLASLRKLDLSYTKIRSLPESIGKLRCLSDQWELPKAIGMLDKLEELYLGNRDELVGEIPDEIGDLSSLRVLNLCRTGICRVPGKINRLSHLSTLDLTGCDNIIELPELPASLIHLRITSRSLQVVPNLSKLTNLIELVLSDGSKGEYSSNLKHTFDLGWIGRLSKLKELELCLLNIAAPPTELGLLSLLEDLTLFGLNLQPLEQLPPSLHSLKLDNFSLRGPPPSNLKIPSNLMLCLSRLQEIQLSGFSQLQYLHLIDCELQSLSIPSSLRILDVYNCPNVVEIQVPGMRASLENLSISGCESIGRIVLCGEGGSLRVLDQSESSSSESTYCSPGVLCLSNALRKLNRLRLENSKNLLEIQVIGTLLSLQFIFFENCVVMEKLTGISNLKKLQRLYIFWCYKLRVVEGLDELECLTSLHVKQCYVLETLLDISNSKIPDECEIMVDDCRMLLDSGGPTTFKHYKRMARQGAPQSETNKEKAKMEEDAEEPNTELQLHFHPVASSQDHDISKEPPIYNVKEGTLPGNQNQTRQQDTNPLSISPLSSTQLQLQFHPSASSWDHEINEEPPIDDVREGTPPGNRNQSREQDSNPQSNSLLSCTEPELQFHPSGSRDHEINGGPPIDDVREGTPPGNQNQTREQDSNPQSISPLLSMFRYVVLMSHGLKKYILNHNLFLQVVMNLLDQEHFPIGS